MMITVILILIIIIIIIVLNMTTEWPHNKHKQIRTKEKNEAL